MALVWAPSGRRHVTPAVATKTPVPGVAITTATGKVIHKNCTRQHLVTLTDGHGLVATPGAPQGRRGRSVHVGCGVEVDVLHAVGARSV